MKAPSPTALKILRFVAAHQPVSAAEIGLACLRFAPGKTTQTIGAWTSDYLRRVMARHGWCSSGQPTRGHRRWFITAQGRAILDALPKPE